MNKTLLLFIIALGIFACEKDKFSSKIVVQSYLEPEKPITVKLTRVSTEEYGDELPVNNARVCIIIKGNSHFLNESGNIPGLYIYEGAELIIVEGEKYSLSIVSGEDYIYAETIIPHKPTIMNIESLEYINPSSTSFGIDIVWGNVAEYYMVSIKNKSCEIECEPVPDLENFSYTPYFLVKPYSFNQVNLPYYLFRYYGNYIIKITSVNEEYKKLYDYKEIFRYDKQPLETNIQNGLGIFTGVSSDSIVIKIKKP